MNMTQACSSPFSEPAVFFARPPRAPLARLIWRCLFDFNPLEDSDYAYPNTNSYTEVILNRILYQLLIVQVMMKLCHIH